MLPFYSMFLHLVVFSIAIISCTEFSTEIITTEVDTTAWKPTEKKSNTTMMQRCRGYYFDDLILIKKRRKQKNSTSTKRACSTIVHLGILDDLIYIEEPSDNVAAPVTDFSDLIDFGSTTEVMATNTDFQVALNEDDSETGPTTKLANETTYFPANNFSNDSNLQTTTEEVEPNTVVASNVSLIDHTKVTNLD